MPELPSRPGSSDSSQTDQALTDRVLARVRHASQVVDRRPGSRGPSRATDREARSLRRVFRDLGDSYRAYRHRTGQPVSEDVRAAAVRFRKDRDITALVLVAASLDRLEILPW
jgi:hypothetical protein